MKKIQWMLGVAAFLVMAEAGAAAISSSPFKVSASKKTVSKTKSETQQLPRGSTRMEQKEIVYQFEIKNQSTDYSQQDLVVRWVVMMERPNGKSYQTPSGEKTTVLPFGRPVTVETDPVSLSERTWQGASGRTADSGQVIQGYGLQILTQDGQLLMETYDPEALKEDIQWDTPEKPDLPPRRNRPGNRANKPFKVPR